VCAYEPRNTEVRIDTGRSPDMIVLALHFGVALWVITPFVYFMNAGAKIFTAPELRDGGAQLGQLSFVASMMSVLCIGLFQALVWYQAVCGMVLALSSLMLYEWTRRTVIDRHFYTGLGGEVPAAVCENGPYKFVRHPFYLSYMVAFFSAAVAFPSLVTSAVSIACMGLFVYMAFDDERVLLASGLAGEYKVYRSQVGMFLPRLGAL
jgi:protein-S-isoprenylcysteine O-methyltransferase Ste14